MTDHEPPDAVLEAIVALADALGSQPPPCFTDPDRWHASNLGPAVTACQDCHALPECGAYAEALGAEQGVWGGVERTRKRCGPAWTAPALTDQEWAS